MENRENRWKKIKLLVQDRQLFFKTLGMMTALSLVTAVVFVLFFTNSITRKQKESIDNLNLHQLRRISSNVDLTFDLMAKSMSRSLWSEDFIDLMIRPDSQDADLAYRVVRILEDSVDENELVRKAYLYLPGVEEVYLYSGVHMPVQELGDKDMIQSYLDIREDGRNPEQTSEWRLIMHNRRIFLATDLCLPNFVGVLFYEVDRTSLYEVIQMENSEYSTTVYVTDESGVLLFDYMTTGPQREMMDDASLFISEENRGGSAEYYRYTSKQSGWNYFVRISTGSHIVPMSSIRGLVLPFVLIYIVASLLFSLYITRSVYQPIRRLMDLTSRPRNSGETGERRGRSSETDMLESFYVESLEANAQYREQIASISADVMEQQVRNILIGKSTNEDQIKEALEVIGWSRDRIGYYLVQVGELAYHGDKAPTVLEKELYQRSLIRIFEDADESEYQMCVCSMGTDRIAEVFCFPKEISVLQIKTICQKRQKQIEAAVERLPYRLNIGCGNVYDSLPSLNASYHEALESIQYQQYIAEGKEEQETDVALDSRYYREKFRRICDMAQKEDPAAALAEARILTELIQDRDSNAAASFQSLADDMMEQLIASRVATEELEKAGVHMPEPPIGAEGLLRFLETTLPILSESEKKSNNRYITDAKEYMAEHYMDGKLNLNEVSEAMGLSYSYLSTIFAEGTGEGLISWLNRYRVENAKRFLAETRLNVSEIGYKCGFNSVQSFGRVFKKYTGLSPRQYRESGEGSAK